jgi:hypothetical protein
MKRFRLVVFALAICTFSHSQTVTPTVLSNNGGYVLSPAGSIEWTIGEPVSDTYIKPSNIATMGFHQPPLDLVTLINEQHAGSGGILVFPNPVRDLLKINFGGLPSGRYAVRMTDAIGKLILTSDADVSESSSSLELKVNEIAAGNYFLIISDNQKFNTTVKINKVY